MELLVDGKRETIPSGSHILQLYNKLQEVSPVASQLFFDGVHHNEKCIAIAPDACCSEINDLLTKADAYTSALEKGQVAYYTESSSFLDASRLNPYKMLARHQTCIAQALREGWRGVRIVIDMSWLARGAATPQEIMKYEAACDAVFTFQNAPVIVLVAYDYAKIPGELVVEMLRLHPIAVVGKYIKRNPYYLNSEQYLLKMLRTAQGQ